MKKIICSFIFGMFLGAVSPGNITDIKWWIVVVIGSIYHAWYPYFVQDEL